MKHNYPKSMNTNYDLFPTVDRRSTYQSGNYPTTTDSRSLRSFLPIESAETTKEGQSLIGSSPSILNLQSTIKKVSLLLCLLMLGIGQMWGAATSTKVQYRYGSSKFTLTYDPNSNYISASDPTTNNGEWSSSSNVPQIVVTKNSSKTLTYTFTAQQSITLQKCTLYVKKTNDAISGTYSYKVGESGTYSTASSLSLSTSYGNNVIDFSSSPISLSKNAVFYLKLDLSSTSTSNYYFCFDYITLSAETSSCTAPTITTQPQGGTFSKDATISLTCAASGTNVNYQWYSNTSASNEGGTIISGATSGTYSAPSSATGTFYYYCVASSSTCTTASSCATIVVQNASADYIAKFEVPSNQSTSSVMSSYDESTNRVNLNKIGGTSSGNYLTLSNGDIYAKPTGDDSYIHLVLNNSKKFQAGDKVEIHVSNSSKKENIGFYLKGRGSSYHMVTASMSAAATDAKGEYTIVAADIETDGSLKFFRVGSDVLVHKIIVTRSAAVTKWQLFSDISGSWAGDDMTVTNGVASITKTGLERAGVYKFKIRKSTDNGSTWTYYGATSSGNWMYLEKHTDWTLTTTNGENVNMTAAASGDYTFTFDTKASEKQLNVTYPTNSVMVTYNMNGKIDNRYDFTETGGTVPEPTAPTHDGDAFLGWYDNQECSAGHEVSFPLTVNSNTTIYAKWTEAWYYHDAWINNWAANVMAMAKDGIYWYFGVPKSDDNRAFKVQKLNTWYGYTYNKPGHYKTNITTMNSSSNSWGCTDNQCLVNYKSGDYYIIVYPPHTGANSTDDPIICASTTLPTTDGYAIPSGITVYFDNSARQWTTPHLRMGRDDHNLAWGMSKVSGTENLWKFTTDNDHNYTNYYAIHVSNNCGWTNSNSIYKTKTEDDNAITEATTFMKASVGCDITITPGSEYSKGTEDQNNNCDFYSYTKHIGLITHTATIGEHTNGTIKFTYTDIAGTQRADVTETTAGLAHTCILTITPEGSTGYEVNKLYVNSQEVSLTDGQYRLVLSEDATISATFKKKTYTIKFVNYDDTELQSSSVEHGETPAYTGSTPTKTQDAQYTYTFNTWDPAIVAATAAATYKATFTHTARTYTITFNRNSGSWKSEYSAPESYTFGTATTLPTASNIERSGNTFGGWYDNEGLTGDAVTAISTTATGNKAYWAKWNTASEECFSLGSISKAPSGGAYVANDVATISGGKVYIPNALGGYDADKKWKLGGNDDSLRIELNNSLSAGDVVSITYSTNGSGSRGIKMMNAAISPTKTHSFTTGSSSVTNHTLTYTIQAGDGFVGLNRIWLMRNTSNDTYISAASITCGTPTTTHTVTFHKNDGYSPEETATQDNIPDGEATKLTTLSELSWSRSGYNFLGWAKTYDGDKEYDNGANITLTADQDLYAKWKEATIAVTGVTLNKNTASVGVDATTTLVATVAPDNASNKSVTWSTSASDVATVSNGVVTGVAAGTAVITVTSQADDTKQATCTVTVTATGDCNELVSFTMPTSNITKNGNKQTVANTKGVYKLASNSDNTNGGWKLYSNGNYVGVETSETFAVGDKVTVNITVKPDNGNYTDLKIYSDESGSTCIGTIAAANVVVGDNEFVLENAVSSGDIYVVRTSSYPQNPFVKSISVCHPTTSTCTAPTIAWNNAPADATVGDATQTLTVTTNQSSPTITWASSNTSVATITNAGVLTIVAAGQTTISAKYTGSGAYCATEAKVTKQITVSPASIAVTGVSLNKTATTINKGQTETLTATIAPANATDKEVSWSSSDETKATVSNGVVTAVAEGTATITVTTHDGSKKATCTVTVTDNTCTNLQKASPIAEATTVTASTTWDLSFANISGSAVTSGKEYVEMKSSGATCPGKNERFILYNINATWDDYNADNAKSIELSGERLRDDLACFQGVDIWFTTNVAGKVRVTFTSNGSSSRFAKINGTATAASSGTETDVVSDWINVAAGEVHIQGCSDSKTGEYLRFKKVEFTATGTSTYSITYDCDGATSGCPNPATVTGQTHLPNPLPTVTKTGYTFGGWFTNSGKTVAATAGAALTANTTLYAKWTAAPTCQAPTAVNITGTTSYNAGQTISLTAAAVGGEGSTTTYKWYKNGSALSGKTSATLSISSCTTSDAGAYSCEVSKGECSTTSYAIQVSVKGSGSCTAPTITTQPQSVSDATLGSAITFTTAATGAAYYQWYTCDNQGNNMDPIEGANAASFTIPTSMQKVATSYFCCKAIAACGEATKTNTVYASIVPVEFTIRYTTYVSTTELPNEASFTANKYVNPAAQAYIKPANLTNIAFPGTTTKPSGGGDGDNWSPVIAVPASASDAEYIQFTYFIERDFHMNISAITIPVYLTEAGETHFEATLTDELGETISGSLTLSAANASNNITFSSLPADKYMVGSVTVKLKVYGKSYRLGENIYLTGTLTSLPTPTIEWASNALKPKSGTVISENAQIQATTNATSGATLLYRSEQPSIADVVNDGNNYYVDYKSVGIANIIATVQGDGILWNSNPPHSVSVNISVDCTSPTLEWSAEPGNIQVGGSNGSGTVTINKGTTVPSGTTLTFESSDPAIATVSQNSRTVTITPVAAGEVAISAKIVGDGTYYCTSAVEIQKEITVSPAAGTYTINYNLNEGTAGANAPTTGTINSNVLVTDPTLANYEFIGWTVTSGLVPSTAKWGTTSTPASPINTCSDRCHNFDGTDVYFKNLCAKGGTVTLTANWKGKCNSGTSTTIYNFTVTSSTTSTGEYTATSGKATLGGSAMGTGSGNEVTIGSQTYYKFNSSSMWTCALTSGTFTAGDVITFQCATSDNKEDKGLLINGKIAVTTDFTKGTASTMSYNVVAEDGIAGQSSFTIKRNDSDIRFGTVRVTRGGGGSGTCVNITYKVSDADVTGSVQDMTSYPSGSNTITIAKNDNTDSKGIFTRTSYTLKNWNTKADGTGTTYTKGQELTNLASSLTLYAIWQSNTTYKVTYDANGGSGEMTDANSPYNTGSTVTVKDNEFTAPTDKEFDYWTTTQAGTGTQYQGGDEYEIKSDITFYAQWKDIAVAKYYTVTYAAGEGATGTPPESKEVLSGDNFVLPDEGNLTKENYSFTGWDDGTSTYTAGQNYIMPASDVTLTAQWKINQQGDCTKPTLGTYTFENNATVGTSTKKTVTTTATSYTAFNIDNMSFSAMNIQYEAGTGEKGGWKIKTAKATIEFCVEDESQVSVKLGMVGSKSGMTITYYKPGATKSTTATLSAKSTNTYMVAAGKKITLTTSGSNTIVLKEINISELCDIAPSVNDIFVLLKENVAITEANKVLIGTINLAGKYTYKDGSISAASHGLTAVYEVDPDDDAKGNVYVYGTPAIDVENANSLKHEVTLQFTQTDCEEEYTVTVSAVIGKAGVKYIAYVIDGSTSGSWGDYSTSSLSKDKLYEKLCVDYIVQPVNCYASVKEDAIKNYYNQFDVVVLTDYPNTGTKRDGVSCSNMMGVLVDIKPVLTMETYVSKLAKWKDKGLLNDPVKTEGADTTQMLKLLCNANDIFGMTTPTDHFKAGSLHKVTTGTAPSPCLQGFPIMNAPDFVFLASITTATQGTLITCCERQYNPAARMIVLGMQSNVYSVISDCGYDIVKGLINYLYISDPASIPDCSLVFDNHGGTKEWNSANNWEGDVTPDELSPVRIDAPCVVNVLNAKAGTIKINHKTNTKHVTANGSLTINADAALTVTKSIYAMTDAKPAPHATDYGDIHILSAATGNGALILENSEGNTKATVDYYSIAYGAPSNRQWQWMTTPFNDVSDIQDNYPNSWMRHYDNESHNWIDMENGSSMYPFGGYELTQATKGTTYEMTGTLASTANQTITLQPYLNLIGNSWTAPINISAFTTDDFKNARASIVMINTGQDVNGSGTVATIDAETTDDPKTPGTYVEIPINVAAKIDAFKVIPSMQSFQIRANSTGGSLTLDYNRLVRTSNVNIQPMRAPGRAMDEDVKDNGINESLRIYVQGNRYGDYIYLFQHDETTMDFDNGWDGNKYIPNNFDLPVLMARTNSNYWHISTQPQLAGTQIAFYQGEDKIYTIGFDYSGYETLWFYDNITDQYTAINNDNTYVFISNTTAMQKRFEIRDYNPNQSTMTNLDEKHQSEAPFKFIQNNHLYIINHGQLYDGQGKLVK